MRIKHFNFTVCCTKNILKSKICSFCQLLVRKWVVFTYYRANYLTYCLKHYDLREDPSPIGNGWKLENGKCRVVRYTRGPLPDCNYLSDSSSESSSEDDSDSDITEYGSSTDGSLYSYYDTD